MSGGANKLIVFWFVAAVLAITACGRGEISAPSATTEPIAMAPWCDDVEPPGPVRDGALAGRANPDLVLMGVLQTYGQARPDTYAGMWIDRESGGTVVVGFTDDPAPHRSALAGLRPSPDDVSIVQPRPPISDDRTLAEAGFAFDVVKVAYTLTELGAVQADAQGLFETRELGMFGNGQALQVNRISLDFEVVDDETRRVVAEQLPLDAVCVNGTDAASITTLDPSTPTTLIPPPGRDPLVSCSGFTFPLSAADQAPGFEQTDDPLAIAFREGMQANPMMFGMHDSQPGGWVVLARDDEKALLGTGDPPTNTVSMEYTGRRWIWSGSGGCQLRVALPAGLGEVSWVPAGSPAPTDTEINVIVSEQNCTGGQPIGDRLVGPEVLETPERVLIAFAVEPLRGGAFTCQGNPLTPVTVTLDAPVGDRELVDGTLPYVP